MKYFTREYYEKNEKILNEYTFSIDSRAIRKDESFFKEIYSETYKNYCTNWGEILTLEDFNHLFENKVKYIEDVLPSYIIEKIADIRIAGMGIVCEEIFNEISQYNHQLIQFCENARTQYRKELACSMKHFSNNCIDSINCDLSDASLINYEVIEKDLYLSFSLDAYTVENSYDLLFIFEEGSFIEKSGPLKNDSLLNYEIYYENGQIEFHMIGIKSQCILSAKDLRFEFSNSYKYREGL